VAWFLFLFGTAVFVWGHFQLGLPRRLLGWQSFVFMGSLLLSFAVIVSAIVVALRSSNG